MPSNDTVRVLPSPGPLVVTDLLPSSLRLSWVEPIAPVGGAISVLQSPNNHDEVRAAREPGASASRACLHHCATTVELALAHGLQVFEVALREADSSSPAFFKKLLRADARDVPQGSRFNLLIDSGTRPARLLSCPTINLETHGADRATEFHLVIERFDRQGCVGAAITLYVYGGPTARAPLLFASSTSALRRSLRPRNSKCLMSRDSPALSRLSSTVP